jgi:nucleotide-binding universal stress UspA family protein
MKIFMAHDGSEHADRALERAAEIAGRFDASLSVVMVAMDDLAPSGESSEEAQDVGALGLESCKMILSRVAEWLSSRWIRADSVVEHGRPQDRILEMAELMGADMIVVGSRGDDGDDDHLLGSVSSKIAEQARCDVLIVK